MEKVTQDHVHLCIYIWKKVLNAFYYLVVMVVILMIFAFYHIQMRSTFAPPESAYRYTRNHIKTIHTVKLVYKEHLWDQCGPYIQVVFICRLNTMGSIHLETCKTWSL